MESCDIWAEVDFGRGPVDIRCTVPGRHSRHMCVVELGIPASQTEPVRLAHNVFTTDVLPLGMHDRD